MKKLILLLLMVFSVYSCYNPEKNCKDFHTGTFKFETYINGELVTSTFIRNDSIEIEEFQGEIDTSSVRWVNDCEYILRNLNPDNMAEEKAIEMRILTTNKNGYTFEYGVVGDPQKSRGSVTRVEKD
ncbi:DNA topoisomerase IV [Christiangramia fulva]|uniref:DNA topoisomerase IV n=1 Tax=Christiangramia fulva TaxID=2126553 RepID=A0A2R3Z7L6_9FLAO|nr:DNA topoisomerase IV [Christiangramia fulva]AVR46269.1 DNA topoisomerase IV [Christiangramia fulva]